MLTTFKPLIQEGEKLQLMKSLTLMNIIRQKTPFGTVF